MAASTISLLMLSLDRYATVKHPRLAQLRQRRFLPAFLAFAAWISAFGVSILVVLENGPDTAMPAVGSLIGINHTAPIASALSQTLLIENNTKSDTFNANSIADTNRTDSSNATTALNSLRQLNFATMQMPNVLLTIYTLLVFILPGIGVILNHLGVHHKLCALSLTARAAHGELPLPMPIMRRPTHMIIVTGMANAE